VTNFFRDENNKKKNKGGIVLGRKNKDINDDKLVGETVNYEDSDAITEDDFVIDLTKDDDTKDVTYMSLFTERGDECLYEEFKVSKDKLVDGITKLFSAIVLTTDSDKVPQATIIIPAAFLEKTVITLTDNREELTRDIKKDYKSNRRVIELRKYKPDK
jgi:hypothetical protein